MKAHDLRKAFLRYFSGNKKLPHSVIDSASLVPASDASVLFSIAGMQQFKPYFLGKAKEASKDFGANRLVSVQKCFRVADIDEVGDDTHLTFFEMLGNFSIGNYFKKEAIDLAWAFVTSTLGIPKNRLVVTYFGGDAKLGLPADTETKKLWEEKRIPKERIISTGATETFWGPPGKTGPCGPSTEIHFDKNQKKPFAFTPDRFVEIWNVVFMEYEKKANGAFTELSQKNIDTGMGLERLAMIMESKNSVFDTSLFESIISRITKDKAFDARAGNSIQRSRIVADHLRATVFLLSDEVPFGKKEQQAVLRRIFRKALNQYRNPHPDIQGILTHIIKEYGKAYPRLTQHADRICDEALQEQKLYENSQERKVETFVQKIRHSGITQSQTENFSGPSNRILTADEAFQLNTTYGFALDRLREEGYVFDIDELEKKIVKHKEKSKEGAQKKFGGHGLDTIHQADVPEEERKRITRLHTATHLLHAVLRKMFGNEVQQQGSDINSERLRFDFSFSRKLTDDEKKRIEQDINSVITSGYVVIREEMPLKEALHKGAIAFFREKYPEVVSVYSVVHPKTEEIFSMELCGGPHVKNTKEIGQFSIISEKSSSKGIRRIKAVVSGS